jgi:hypothetical protein
VDKKQALASGKKKKEGCTVVETRRAAAAVSRVNAASLEGKKRLGRLFRIER